MATLINKVTEQKVEGVDAAHFLANVEDAANWVPHEAAVIGVDLSDGTDSTATAIVTVEGGEVVDIALDADQTEPEAE